MRKNYGLPYMGSKNKLAEEIVNFLPQKKVLVDLFGGGGAISVCASQSGKYEKIIYNELNSLISETFQKAINGDYENERRWVSREEFEKLKKTDGYVAICFSFSNNCNTYMYGPKIEPYKRAYHYAIIFDDFGPFNELFDDETTEKIKKSVEGITDLKDRRIKFSHALGDYILSLEKCGPIENKEKLDTVKYTVDAHPTYIGHVSQHLQYKERFDLLKQTVQIFDTYIGNVLEPQQRSERLNTLKHTINMYGTPRNMCQNLEQQERVLTLKRTMSVKNETRGSGSATQHIECQEKFDLLKRTICGKIHSNENLERQERISTLKHTSNVNALENCGLGRDSITHGIGSTFQNRVLEGATIEVFNKDYADVELPSPEDCVIYCDIPYENTTSYTTGNFDYERFYKWCQEKAFEGYQIFVSSYELPEDLFISVWEKQRHCKATSGSGKHVVEKIYTVRK